MTDSDIQLLETYLDGQLAGQEARDLQSRLAGDAQLRELLDELQSQRMARAGFFAAIEPDEPAISRTVAFTRAQIARRQGPRMPRIVRWALAAAACILAGFLAGWLLRDASRKAAVVHRTPAPPAHVVAPCRVAITDEYGRVIHIQHFDSPERARQFTEDLELWQDRLDQLRTGLVTVRSASF